MKDKLRAYLDSLFADAPKTQRAYELREELLSNLNAKYDDRIALGHTEEEAYQQAVAGIGDVSELIAALGSRQPFDEQRMEKSRQKSAVLVSTAVAFYILAVVPVIILQSVAGVVLMFVLLALATGLIIYNGMTRPKYYRQDETVVEEFKQWNSQNGDRIRLRRAISSAMWPLIVVIYLLVSFYYGAWAYSWIIFIIGAAIENIIKLAFEVKGP